jgi:hypothetical protein
MDRSLTTWVPVVLWMAGMAWASVTPPVAVPSGTDLWLHGIAYGILTLLLRRALALRGGVRRALAAAAVACAYGALLEGVQAALPYRTAEVRDLLANAIGAGVGVLISLTLRSISSVLVIALVLVASGGQMGLGQPGPITTQPGAAGLEPSGFAAARAAGIRAVKIVADWSAIEPRRGQPTWSDLDRVVEAAAQAGLAPVMVLAYTPPWASLASGPELQRPEIYARQPPRDPQEWGRFVGAASARDRDRVRDWQVWTQLGLPLFRGTGAEYLTILQTARARIRATDPGARVAMATPVGMDLTFVVRMLASASDAFDVIALSPRD